MELKQIMPETRSELRPPYDLGNDPYDSRDKFLPASRTFANCAIGMARLAFLPRTTRDHLAMKASRRRLFARRDASIRRKVCKSACHRTAAEVDVQQQPRRYPSRDRI